MNLTFKKSVAQPIDRVFEVFSDFEHAPERVQGIERLELLTEGPIGKGTRFRETRIMFKREATEEMEITEFEPNRRYTVGADSCGCRFQTEFTFRSRGAGTEIDVAMQSKPLTLFAKLMAPLGILMAGSMKKLVERDLDDLKAYAERSSG